MTPEMMWSVVGGVVLVLLAVIAWLIKDRLRRNEKDKEILNMRLSAGCDNMARQLEQIENMRTRLDALQAQVMELYRDVAACNFQDYKKEHKEDHVKLDRAIAKLAEGQEILHAEMKGVAERLDGRLATMTSLLSKVTRLGSVEEE